MSRQVKCASNFLFNAPPGEYEQCSAALNALVEDKTVVESARNETNDAWHENNYYLVSLGDHNAITCSEARYRKGVYEDPQTRQLFEINWETKLATFLEETTRHNGLVDAIQNGLNGYCQVAYKENSACGCYLNNDDDILIVLRSASVSLKNYRTGAVYASYKLKQDGSLTGRIQSKQHFFESGNALCEYGSNLKTKINMGDDNSTAEEVILAIASFEKEWMSSASATFEKVNSEALFKLRRKIPVTHTLIQWEREFTGSFIA